MLRHANSKHTMKSKEIFKPPEVWKPTMMMKRKKATVKAANVYNVSNNDATIDINTP